MFESLAGLTLQSAIKTALELADRRLEKQNEKMERSRASEKGKSVNGEQDDDDQSIAPHTVRLCAEQSDLLGVNISYLHRHISCVRTYIHTYVRTCIHT